MDGYALCFESSSIIILENYDKSFHSYFRSCFSLYYDILLFFDTESSHAELPYKFHTSVHHFCIMLSEKNMIIVKEKTDFLGMHINDGSYVAQPHIIESFKDFSDKDHTKKYIQ